LNDYFLSDFKKSGEARKARLAESYSDLITKVKSGYESTITPTDLKAAVSKRAPQFSGYGQQDA
jgi:uncharacterized UBP type Zn finger protein